MKRALVLSIRNSKDSQTGEDLAWVSLAIMPVKMQNGKGLFYPKSSELVVNTCFGETRHPDNYVMSKKIKIGSLVNIHYVLNEMTNKAYISKIEEYSPSPFTDNDLYL